MTQIISQDELDTLLASITVAEARRRPAPESATVALHDFRHTSRLSPDHLRGLQARLTALTGVLNRTMSLYLNSNAHFYVHSLDVTSYEQYLRNLAATPILGVIAFDSGAPPALWEISAPLAYAALDCMLGGKGEMEEQPSGEATAIERAILRRLFQEILSSWCELWDRLKAVRPQVEAVVTSHAHVNLRAMDERLFTAMLGTTIGETSGMIRLCVPLSVIKRLLRDEREVVSEADLGASPGDLPTAEPMAQMPVPVTACLEPPTMPLSELMQMQPGTVLNLRLSASEPFVVRVGTVDKFRGQGGAANGRLAIQITSSVR